MHTRQISMIDGNEAVARVAYALNEVIAIYPITPATPMGEWADQWAAESKTNLWGTVPSIVEMQSEGGAAGALHGAIQTGALGTTFTSSQGLLLMLPNLFKIAGELTPTVIHVASRTVATHALSIFGDHSDVMAVRAAGWPMLCSSSVQEAHDFALIAQAAAFEARLPFLHFFDGFRTSHEIAKIELLDADICRQMIDEQRIAEHRARALSPDHPVLRGTAQNPDVFFQAREAVNSFYAHCPRIVHGMMERFGNLTGRCYRPFDYYGAPEADRVIVILGSGGETAKEAVDYLVGRGERVGVLQVRLYRPFDTGRFRSALPATVQALAVLDRTKEPGAGGEPLYLDCVGALYQSDRQPAIVGGRYGLSSKEFTPAMVMAIFDNLKATIPRHPFTIGIRDDVSGLSLPFEPALSIEQDDVFRAVFYGLGSDGTVGANKETIKIIGESTDHFAQGYFVYDSKKAGAITVSHLRFGPRAIRSSYLISEAQFVACHHPLFLERFDVSERLANGGTLLLNISDRPEDVWKRLPKKLQEALVAKNARLFAIDAARVARESGLGTRINIAMQACFFAISKVLPLNEGLERMRDAIRKVYGRKGAEIVAKNLAVVELALGRLHEIFLGSASESEGVVSRPMPAEAPEFTRNVLQAVMLGHGDTVPVSALPCDGTFPTGTAQWEKRNLAQEIPVWNAALCIQCAKCVMVCPHAAIRGKVYDPAALQSAPPGFQAHDARLPQWKDLKFTLQVATEDCTGCGICVEVCPVRDKSRPRVKAINMEPQAPLREAERENWEFFVRLPEVDRRAVPLTHVRSQQIQQPLFEFSGACAGCGETPYLKLLTQLFGDRLLVANATGCSSIYGGNLPTTPWSHNAEGRGPAWSNSLFEDTAEFGLGFRVSLDKQRTFALELLKELEPSLGGELVGSILSADQTDEAGIMEQRDRVLRLKIRLAALKDASARRLEPLADTLVRKSVWIVGGDGWGYDIGFGGLDHVLASGANVKVLLLDTEVYSNTGGQCSKATPRGAVAKFASAGKRSAKKDLGQMAMSYGHVYVASVAMGARDEHTLKAFLEAESYEGPSLIIAYSHCIAHGIDMRHGMAHQKAAVDCGQWLLYRYDPRQLAAGRTPLQLDSPAPCAGVHEYFAMEERFRRLSREHPTVAETVFDEAQRDSDARRARYQHLAQPATKPPSL